MRHLKIAALAAVLSIFGIAHQASATPVILNLGGYGTITVTQVGPESDGVVDVLVTLNSGVEFVNTGSAPPGNHPDLAFTLAGNDSISSVSALQDGNGGAWAWAFYDVHSSPVSLSDGFGKYEYALYCSNCGSGDSNGNPGPLEFQIALAGITPQSFIANGSGTVFAADLFQPDGENGRTGLVRTTGDPNTPTSPVPEPTSLLLLGTGLFGTAAATRRRLLGF
jgi:hypothetical protein